MPVATRSRGNSSRMIPNASGNTAPAAPCTARPAIRSSRLLDSAHISEPTANSPSTTTSMRSLPNMSPSRPRIGVAIDALSRYTVRTQVTCVGVAPSSCWISGSAGATIVCSSA